MSEQLSSSEERTGGESRFFEEIAAFRDPIHQLLFDIPRPFGLVPNRQNESCKTYVESSVLFEQSEEFDVLQERHRR